MTELGAFRGVVLPVTWPIVLCPTRLETRTEEFTGCASVSRPTRYAQ